jgi:hypothetical protein
MRIEQRDLLLAAHGIVGVVDVGHDPLRRRLEAAAAEIDLPEPDAGEARPSARCSLGRVKPPSSIWSPAANILRSVINMWAR